MESELITPVAMDKGLRFAIREGGRTVGAGTVRFAKLGKEVRSLSKRGRRDGCES
jgi:hypothetical protein